MFGRGQPLPGYDPKTGAGGTSDFLTTRLDKMVAWARSNSLWPLPFATACCGIEFMSVVSSHYDLSRFGAEVVRFSPRQSDLLIVAGTVNDRMGPILKTIYDPMPEPKWVIAMGVCASSGGFYRADHVMQGIEAIESTPTVGVLKELFPGAVTSATDSLGDLSLTVERDSISRVARALKEHPRLRYDMLLDVCGLDRMDLGGEAGPRFHVVYHFY